MSRLNLISYDREKAVSYAKKWALGRNPQYFDFSGIGGDCTNFASQCLYAGSGTMNHTPNLGWYYINLGRRSPSWTGVPFFYNFLTKNKGVGPFGHNCRPDELEIGDFVQISFNGKDFAHNPVITRIDGMPSPDTIYIATHTKDSMDRRLSTYAYKDLRYIHIDGVRKWY